MNENQIVLSLLSFYKNEGIDLHAILDDPIFIALPLPAKIQMIKDHAKAIHDGTTTGMSRREWRGVGRDVLLHGIMGGMTGAAATATTAKLFAGGKISPMAVTLAAASGVGSGIGLSLMRRISANREKMELKNYLGAAATNPTDESALRVLAKRNLQNSSRAADLASYNKFLDRVGANADEKAKNVSIKTTVETNTAAGRKMLVHQ